MDKSFFVVFVLCVDEIEEQIGFPDCALSFAQAKVNQNALLLHFLILP